MDHLSSRRGLCPRSERRPEGHACVSPALGWGLMARREVRIPQPEFPARRHVAMWNRHWTPWPAIAPSGPSLPRRLDVAEGPGQREIAGVR